MTVFMLIVDSLMPETSDTVPVVTIFFGAAMIEMMVMIIATCFILKMHFTDQPIPKWMRHAIYENLSYKLGIRSRPRKINSKKNTISSLSAQQNNNGYFNHAQENTCETDMSGLLSPRTVALINNHKKQIMSVNDNARSKENTHVPLISKEILNKLDLLLMKFKNEEETERIQGEWKICAYTIDRLCLIVFLLIYVVTVLSCFISAQLLSVWTRTLISI